MLSEWLENWRWKRKALSIVESAVLTGNMFVYLCKNEASFSLVRKSVLQCQNGNSHPTECYRLKFVLQNDNRRQSRKTERRNPEHFLRCIGTSVREVPEVCRVFPLFTCRIGSSIHSNDMLWFFAGSWCCRSWKTRNQKSSSGSWRITYPRHLRWPSLSFHKRARALESVLCKNYSWFLRFWACLSLQSQYVPAVLSFPGFYPAHGQEIWLWVWAGAIQMAEVVTRSNRKAENHMGVRVRLQFVDLLQLLAPEMCLCDLLK